MKNKINRNIYGVTLVELMIALAVTSILLIGVGSIYGNAKKTYSIDEEFARLQENARIAMRYITEDIRMAGYVGCAWNNGDTTKFQCYLNPGSYACGNATTGIEGFDNNTAVDGSATMSETSDVLNTGSSTDWSNSGGANTLPTGFPASPTDPILASDILIVRHADGPGLRMTDNQSSANFTIANAGSTIGTNTCHTPTGLCENDILIVSDCNKARIFQTTDIQDTSSPADSLLILHAGGTVPGNAAPVSWGGAGSPDNFVAADTEILKYNTSAYYVANNIADEPALYRHDGIAANAPVELVEGIENIQLLYGVDTDDDGIANRYTSADSIDFTSTTNSVVSVRISMLVRGKEEIPTRPDRTNTYTMATTDIIAITDKRLRKTFTTTIKIRNKGL